MSGLIDLNKWLDRYQRNGQGSVEATARLREALKTAVPADFGARGAHDLLRPQDPMPPVLDTEATLYGRVGQVVRELTRETEAHPAGIVFPLFAAVGNASGLTPWYEIAGDTHRARLFVVLVGPSGEPFHGFAAMSSLPMDT
jgi:hypothetical protein